jgi:hypothetical protein
MLLLLQVMRPEEVSYEDVQNAHPLPAAARVLPKPLRQYWAEHYVLENSLYRWKQTVESHQDLYLPAWTTARPPRASGSSKSLTAQAQVIAGLTGGGPFSRRSRRTRSDRSVRIE